MKLIKLTRPDGKPVWLTYIYSVSESTERRATEIKHGGGIQYVRETPEEVIKLLEKGE